MRCDRRPLSARCFVLPLHGPAGNALRAGRTVGTEIRHGRRRWGGGVGQVVLGNRVMSAASGVAGWRGRLRGVISDRVRCVGVSFAPAHRSGTLQEMFVRWE